MVYQKSKAKQTIVNQEKISHIVRQAIYDMADIVGATLGPSGRTVLIERDGMPPLITKDGVTVAKALGCADAATNIIIDSAKEICLNTAKEAGDGTTTAIVLASAIVKEGQKFLEENPKYNPQKLARELSNAYGQIICPKLRAIMKAPETEEDLLSVATISANGDREVAEVVVKAVISAGDDGTVMIEESQGRETKVESLDGYVITTGLKEHGQIGPIFINDKASQQVKTDAAYVVLYNGALNDLKVPGLIQDVLMTEGVYVGTPIIVVAHSFADTVLEKFAKSCKAGAMVIPVKTPRSGLPNGASMFLDDMAAYTGAKVYDPGNVDDIDASGIGDCDSFRMNMYEAFLCCSPDIEVIESRIQEIKAIEQSAFSDFDRAFLKAAIAKLTGGISTIFVGGVSDLEVREKKARVEDAVEAVRSAIAEGIVAGGCRTHLICRQALIDAEGPKSYNVLINALSVPMSRLIDNCGEEFLPIWQTITENIKSTDAPIVYDADNHEFVDPFEVGIIEPAKVCRVAVGNAISVAALLITLGGIIVAPRDAALEAQLDLANNAFKNMMDIAND